VTTIELSGGQVEAVCVSCVVWGFDETAVWVDPSILVRWGYYTCIPCSNQNRVNKDPNIAAIWSHRRPLPDGYRRRA
jgi:hypothetical protein